MRKVLFSFSVKRYFLTFIFPNLTSVVIKKEAVLSTDIFNLFRLSE